MPEQATVDYYAKYIYERERVAELEATLDATRHALHEACLKIGSTDGFREAFARAGRALESKGKGLNDG